MRKAFLYTAGTIAAAYLIGYCLLVPILMLGFANTTGAHGNIPTTCRPAVFESFFTENGRTERTRRDISVVCDYRSAGEPWVSHGYFAKDGFVQFGDIDQRKPITPSTLFACSVKLHDFGLPYRIVRIEAWDSVAGIWNCERLS